MSVVSALDFVRVVFAFLFVFLVTPLISEIQKLRRSSGPIQWVPLLICGFIRASLAAEVTCLILGQLRLCLPGIMIFACVGWCVRGLLVEQSIHPSGVDRWGRLWHGLITVLDGDRPSAAQHAFENLRPQWPQIAWKGKLILALGCLLLVAYGRVALHQVSFEQSDNYLRAISLSGLTQGQSWETDPSVALLAPLLPFSGLSAASVIRFTGPILATVFSLLLTFCIWRVWRSTVTALVCLLLFVCVSVFSIHASWELIPGSIACVYWVAAGAIWPDSRKYALLAGLVGFMIAPREWVAILICGLIVVALCLVARTRTHINRRAASFVANVIFIAVFLFWRVEKAPARVFQYESAARVCEQIGRNFHRNDWLVISPFQELAFTYGQGWHFELSTFVSQFTLDQVSKRTFSFPYESSHVFFFVERRPLALGSLPGDSIASWRYAPASSSDWSAFLYGDPLGRASLQYRAAELLAGYARSHKNISVFYEDNDLVVYHLLRNPAGS
jgi:hypothetical protein